MTYNFDKAKSSDYTKNWDLAGSLFIFLVLIHVKQNILDRTKHFNNSFKRIKTEFF